MCRTGAAPSQELNTAEPIYRLRPKQGEAPEQFGARAPAMQQSARGLPLSAIPSLFTSGYVVEFAIRPSPKRGRDASKIAERTTGHVANPCVQ